MLKKINYSIGLILSVVLSSCSEKKHEYIVPDFPILYDKWSANYVLNPEDTLNLEVQVSPMDSKTKINWFLDGKNVSTTNRYTFYAGAKKATHDLELIVSREKYENKRKAQIKVVSKAFEPKKFDKAIFGMLRSGASTRVIDWKSITHLVCVDNIIGTAGWDSTTVRKDLNLIIQQAHNEGVYVILSLHGITSGEYNMAPPYGNNDLYTYISDPDNRNELQKKVRKFVTDHKLDGIDISFNQNPINQLDGQIIAAYVQKTAQAVPVEKIVCTTLITGWMKATLDPLATIPEIDYYFIKLFDFVDIKPVHHSSLWQMKNGYETGWKTLLPHEKVILGIPAFGIKYTFPDDLSGINWGNSWKYTNYVSQNKIASDFESIFNQQDEIVLDSGKNHRIFYNTSSTLQEKAAYIKDQNLGGCYIQCIDFEVTGDAAVSNILNKALNTR